MISWILIHTKENIADRCVSSLGKVSPLRYLEPTKYITRFIPNGIYFLTLWYSNFLSVLSLTNKFSRHFRPIQVIF